MEINSTAAASFDAQVSQRRLGQNRGEMRGMPSTGRPPGGEAMREAIGSLSEEERREVAEYHKDMAKAVKSGDFDAAEWAENAPEALKQAADKNGIDLKKAFGKFSEHVQSGGFPPPPGRGGQMMPPGPPPPGAQPPLLMDEFA